MDEKRRFTRIPMALRVRAAYRDLDSVVAAVTLDVSRGGLYVSLPAPRPVGTLVTVSFELGSPPVQLELEGMIVRIMVRDEVPLVGVELVKPMPAWDRFCEILEAHRAAGDPTDQ